MNISQNSYIIKSQNSSNILSQIHTKLKSSNSHFGKFSSMKIEPISDHKILRRSVLYLNMVQTISQVVYTVLRSGHPLNYDTHTSMEQRLNHNISQVRVGYEGAGQ
jgi:hypothetical protein